MQFFLQFWLATFHNPWPWQLQCNLTNCNNLAKLHVICNLAKLHEICNLAKLHAISAKLHAISSFTDGTPYYRNSAQKYQMSLNKR